MSGVILLCAALLLFFALDYTPPINPHVQEGDGFMWAMGFGTLCMLPILYVLIVSLLRKQWRLVLASLLFVAVFVFSHLRYDMSAYYCPDCRVYL